MSAFQAAVLNIAASSDADVVVCKTEPHDDFVSQVCWDYEGERLFTFGKEQLLRSFDARTGKLIQKVNPLRNYMVVSSTVFLRTQAAACKFFRSDFAAYIRRNTVSFCFWDKTFMLDVASNRGWPIFGGDFYSKKYGIKLLFFHNSQVGKKIIDSFRNAMDLGSSFIPSLMLWPLIKNIAFGGEKQKQKEQR